jgi:hypothetical protein
VSLAKNSPKGPKTLTLSPGFRLKTQEDILPGGMPSLPGGGVAIADVELDHALFFRVVRHGIGADRRFVALRFGTATEPEALPVAPVLLGYVEILVT